MKKLIATSGLFLVIIILTSFTSPVEISGAKSIKGEISGAKSIKGEMTLDISGAKSIKGEISGAKSIKGE